EGSRCENTETASLPSQECGPSLTCVDKVCVLNTDKPCVKKVQERLRDGATSEMVYGSPAPDCDIYGDFKPKRCKKGLICHCVDKNGTRIFGTALHSVADEMHCNCSRLQALSMAVAPERRLRCTANGNLSPLQCSDTHCYCLTPDGRLDGPPVPIKEPIQRLKCCGCLSLAYFTHEYAVLWLHACMLEDCGIRRGGIEGAQGSSAEVREEAGAFIAELNHDPPTCDPDGSYAPRQCKGNKCYCVSPSGKAYDMEKYSVPRYSKEAEEMTCNCLREQRLLWDAGPSVASSMLVTTFRLQRCARNGNYLPMQCTTPSSCRCVDSDGYQNSPDVMAWERKRLNCYKEEYDHYFKDEIEDF
ncbi:hypothetical protein HPB47_005635, partial [Ixodes persulcatus]